MRRSLRQGPLTEPELESAPYSDARHTSPPSMLRAFAYSSFAAPGLVDEKLRSIVSQSATFNRMAGVTGAMLVDGTRFFQYIEGPSDGLEAVFRRIEQSRSHTLMRTLLDAPIAQRAAPYWAMTRLDTGQTVVSGLINAGWDEFGQRSVAHSPGMELLCSVLRPHFPVANASD